MNIIPTDEKFKNIFSNIASKENGAWSALIEKYGDVEGTIIFGEISHGVNDYFKGADLSYREMIENKISNMTNTEKFIYLSNVICEIGKFFIDCSDNPKLAELRASIDELTVYINDGMLSDNSEMLKNQIDKMLDFLEEEFDFSACLMINLDEYKSVVDKCAREIKDDVESFLGNNPNFALDYATAVYIYGDETDNEDITKSDPYTIGVTTSGALDIDAILKTSETPNETYEKIYNSVRIVSYLLMAGGITALSFIGLGPHIAILGLKILFSLLIGFSTADLLESWIPENIKDNAVNFVTVNYIKLADKVTDVVEYTKNTVLPGIEKHIENCISAIDEYVVEPIADFLGGLYEKIKTVFANIKENFSKKVTEFHYHFHLKN